jgi:sugar fermentation stimulation protein A
MNADRFTIARDIDPAYARAFDEAMAAGVEAIPVVCDVTPQGIEPVGRAKLM